MKKSNLAADIIADYQRMSGTRGNFESHWQEVAERMIPNHSQQFLNRGMNYTEGNKRTQELYDSTAMIALNRFAAILDSLLTPRNQTWHRLVPSDPKLMKSYPVRLWFEEVNRILFKYRYEPHANFASQNQQNYKSLGGYGTGSLFIDALGSGHKGVRYRNIHLGEIYFDENHQGIVNKAVRRFQLSARQAIEQFGDKVSDRILETVKTNPDFKFFFLHAVFPRADRDPSRKDFKGMPFASYYLSLEDQEILSEGGFRTFPYAISRYEQAPGEVYGRSPAMDILPAVKSLNEQKKTMLKQGHRAIDPVLLAHDDGVVDGFSLKPGALNIGGVSADGRPLVHALPVGNIAAGKEMMDDERAVINDAFLVTIFQILVETPQMTATEVLERTREKGILLAPTIGRQQSEYLGPMVEREIDVLMDQGLIPPAPFELLEAQGEYKLEYDSPLTRAQRAEEAAGLMRTLESTLQVVNITQNPEPLDFFNWDVIIPQVSEIQGVPVSWMRSLDQVQSIRQGRAQQQQVQQAIQAAPGAAAMIKAGAVAQKAQQS
jgi:hypothetical protein